MTPALQGQRQGNPEASLVYIASSRRVRQIPQRSPVLKNKNKQNLNPPIVLTILRPKSISDNTTPSDSHLSSCFYVISHVGWLQMAVEAPGSLSFRGQPPSFLLPAAWSEHVVSFNREKR